jgi:hypothetical protein
MEFVPTATLIQELMRRNTFAGIIIYSPEQHLEPGQVHNHFELCSALDEEGTRLILERTLASMLQE